ISLFRIWASSSSSRSLTCRPASQYFPEVGESRQPIRFISVDLPEPEGPMMATYSPLRISTSTPCKACTCSAPISYVLIKPSVRITIPASTRSWRKDSEGVVSVGIIFSVWSLDSTACLPPSWGRSYPPLPQLQVLECGEPCSCPQRFRLHPECL